MKRTSRCSIWVVCLVLLGTVYHCRAQGERARLQMDYFSLNNSEHQLVATVKTKEDRSYVNVPGVPINFFLESSNPENFLGSDISDREGRAKFKIPHDLWDSLPIIKILAAIIDHDRFRDYSNEIEIIPAMLEVRFDQSETGRVVNVLANHRDSSGQWRAIDDLSLKLYVQRMFGELPLSVDFNTTDENGNAEIFFPEDVPGDSLGNLEVIVKVTDHELYGNLTYRQSIDWGVKSEPQEASIDRELWSARRNAPTYLVIIVNALIIGIWGIIAYIIFNLFRILQKGKEHLGDIETNRQH